MAAIAIDSGLDVFIPADSPDKQARRKQRRARAKNAGRFVRKAVRARGAGKLHWQPSRPAFKRKMPRTAERAEAIREQLDTEALAPQEFWAPPASDIEEYLQERITEEIILIEERHREILDGIDLEYQEKLEHLQSQRKLERLQAAFLKLDQERVIAGDGPERQFVARQLRRVQIDLALLLNEIEVCRQYAA